MKDTDAKLHLVCGELVLGERSVKNLDSNLRVDHGKITFDMRAAGAHEGTLQAPARWCRPAMGRPIST